MVKEVVVTDYLTQEMIEAGVELIRRLDNDANLDVRAALWLYVTESDAWRLMIATPELKVVGPRKLYQKIGSLIKEIDGHSKISLGDISVIDSNDPIIRALKVAIKSEQTDIDNGIRLTRNAIGGQYIEDVYIYRLT